MEVQSTTNIVKKKKQNPYFTMHLLSVESHFNLLVASSREGDCNSKRILKQSESQTMKCPYFLKLGLWILMFILRTAGPLIFLLKNLSISTENGEI